MAENKADKEYEKAMNRMGDELARIHGNKRGYIQWLEGISPFWVRLISYMMIELERGRGIELPLPVFKALGQVFLALNRAAFQMWLHRDWFEVRKQPIPPGIN